MLLFKAIPYPSGMVTFSIDFSDEYNGEILSGANTYINVEYDWEILNEAEKTELENAEKALKEADAGNQTFFTDKKET